MIDLEHVTKQFAGTRRVVAPSDVSLTIPKGQMVSVIGPSGSGTSTLLNLVGGLDRPSSGEVRIDGEALAGLSDDGLTRVRRNKMGFIFQFFNLLPTLSSVENVGLPLHLRGWSRSKVETRARELLELVQLGHCHRVPLCVVFCLAVAATGGAQTNHIDVVAPFAPELAKYGSYTIGVRTVQATDRHRIDIPHTQEGGPNRRYDRTLTLEVWYPARLSPGQQPGGEYRAVIRDPAVTATLYGQAVRDAAPVTTEGAFPLVIVSHGYPGNRFLMSHLCENLASKGFVVVAIDHAESTYDDQQAFASTLYNRPFDQLFVLNELARLGAPNSRGFLAGIVDAAHTGVVGYSMGGYGLVNVIGGGYSESSITGKDAPPNRLLAERAASNPRYRGTMDTRIKAAIAIAPWGMQTGYWDAEGLKGIRTPVLFVAGSADSVAGYEKGTKAIYEGAVNAERYLLTFINANHNAGAPIPPPAEAYRYSEALKSFPFVHYADAVWDNVRMNNILDHFATAYFDLFLKGQQDKAAYLRRSAEGEFPGFQPRTGVGLTLEHQTGR